MTGGIMLTYSLPHGTDLALQVLNGNGKDESEDNINFDTDSEKTGFFRVLQGYENFSFGGFTYFGREKTENGENKFPVPGTRYIILFGKYEPEFSIHSPKRFECSVQSIQS